MGLVVSEDYTNENGFVISDYYVNINDILIIKSGIDEYKYIIEAKQHIYMSRQARNDHKRPIRTLNVQVLTNTVDDIHNQVYTKIKEQYQNYTDDI